MQLWQVGNVRVLGAGCWSPILLGFRCQMRLLQLNGSWNSAIPVPGDKKMKVKLILLKEKKLYRK